MEIKRTLCWSCKKACGGECGCSWFNGFIPVHGWTAVPTVSDSVFYQGKLRKVKSFCVLKCPLYEKEKLKPSALMETETNAEKARRLGVSVRTYCRRMAKLKILERINDSIHK